MPSKGQIQADREAEARKVAARARLDSDVRTLTDGYRRKKSQRSWRAPYW
jgi:hypothetical protein